MVGWIEKLEEIYPTFRSDVEGILNGDGPRSVQRKAIEKQYGLHPVMVSQLLMHLGYPLQSRKKISRDIKNEVCDKFREAMSPEGQSAEFARAAAEGHGRLRSYTQIVADIAGEIGINTTSAMEILCANGLHKRRRAKVTLDSSVCERVLAMANDPEMRNCDIAVYLKMSPNTVSRIIREAGYIRECVNPLAGEGGRLRKRTEQDDAEIAARLEARKAREGLPQTKRNAMRAEKRRAANESIDTDSNV